MVSALLKATYSESVRLVHQTLSLGDELTTPLVVLGHGVDANGYHWQLYVQNVPLNICGIGGQEERTHR
jgi:hypothetical protein